MVSKKPSARTADLGYSMYRAVLVDNGKALSTGGVSQTDLLAALGEHGAVWLIESMPQGSKFIVTFKAPEAVSNLVKQAVLPVGSANLTVEGYKIQSKPAAEDEVCVPTSTALTLTRLGYLETPCGARSGWTAGRRLSPSRASHASDLACMHCRREAECAPLSRADPLLPARPPLRSACTPCSRSLR